MMIRNIKVTWKFQVVTVGIKAYDSDSVDFLTIVLRPSPGSGFWLGHRVGRVNSFFKKKNQNDVVLVKKNKTKKKQKSTGLQPGLAGLTGSPGQLAGSARSHRVFSSLVFSSTSPVPTPGRPGLETTRRAGPGFKTMFLTIIDMSNLYGEFIMVWTRNGAWPPPLNG